MQMDLERLFDKEVFAGMEPERKALFRQFAAQIDGKSPLEAIGLFTQLLQRLPKSKPLSPPERAAIAAAIEEQLAPDERKKFQGILGILDRMKL